MWELHEFVFGTGGHVGNSRKFYKYIYTRSYKYQIIQIILNPITLTYQSWAHWYHRRIITWWIARLSIHTPASASRQGFDEATPHTSPFLPRLEVPGNWTILAKHFHDAQRLIDILKPLPLMRKNPFPIICLVRRTCKELTTYWSIPFDDTSMRYQLPLDAVNLLLREGHVPSLVPLMILSQKIKNVRNS